MSIWTIIMILAIIKFLIIPSFKDRIFPVKKLLITPMVFFYLFYQSVNETFTLSGTNYGIILLGLMIGITIGILLRSKTIIKSDKKQQLIWLPGSCINLIIFILIFSVHFVIGYLQAVNPSYLMQASIGEQWLLFLLSCASSISLGANGFLFCKYLLSDSGTLVLPKNNT